MPTAKAISVAVWNRPSLASSRIAVQAQIDDCGNDDAADRRDQRQNRLVRFAQCPFMDLAANFHAYDQEEQGHQRVVDPEMQRPGKYVITESDGDRQSPEGMIAVGEWRVRPYQRSRRGNQKNGAADGLDMQESVKGTEGLFRQPLRSRQVFE